MSGIETQTMQNVTSLLRGYFYAGLKDGNIQGTEISDLAENYSKENYTNKSGLALALEDFAYDLRTDYESLGSCITKQDCEPLDSNSSYLIPTIYRTNEGQKLFDTNEKIFAAHIFIEDNNKNGGVKYIKDDDDKYESALNFAKADIMAIEKSAVISEVEPYEEMDGKLSPFEGATFRGYCHESEVEKTIAAMDLDGDRNNLSAEEYASWILAGDTLTSGLSTSLAGYGSNLVDGLITKEDKEAINDMDFEYVKIKAEYFYSKYDDAE